MTVAKKVTLSSSGKFIQPRSTSSAVLLSTLAMLLVLAIPQSSFAETTKKKKVTIDVEEDASCPYGVSLSDQTWGSRRLCAPDYPAGAADRLRQHIGQRIELEADFAYSGDSKKTPPDGVKRIIQVAGDKLYDPCSPGKLVTMGLILSAANGNMPTDPLPGCAASADAGNQ
jgi:hypothetical protein